MNKLDYINELEKKNYSILQHIDDTALANQKKILDAFKACRVENRHFFASTGYGYGDIAREKIEELFSVVFHTESALVRPHFASATHAIVMALRALLKPGDNFYTVTGRPYDTIYNAFGLHNGNSSSLSSYGVRYIETGLDAEGHINYHEIEDMLKCLRIKMVFIQRSRGYHWRKALSMGDIGKVVETVKSVDKNIIIYVDNCYGEFTEPDEPTGAGADLCSGSLIKNAGGGLAPTGAYIVGKSKLIDEIAQFFTSPGIGGEIGSYEASYRPFFQGLFMAAHTVAQSLKGAVLFSAAFRDRGCKVMPGPEDHRSDITQSIWLNSGDELIRFCQAVQAASPVDAHVVPEPWDMPGYSDKVIMAAGTFVQGASIELSADGPLREPYIVYLQGGLTYEHCKIALAECLQGLD